SFVVCTLGGHRDLRCPHFDCFVRLFADATGSRTICWCDDWCKGATERSSNLGRSRRVGTTWGRAWMIAEKSLYPIVQRFLRHRGWRVESEIAPRPGSPRRFDVVGVKPRRRQAVVVEVKVKDFSKAMRQAAYRQFVADL